MKPFAERLRELIADRGVTYRALAVRVYQSKTALHDYATGRRMPSMDVVRRLDSALTARGELIALAGMGAPSPPGRADAPDEIEAVELARRVAASDVSNETLRHMQAAFDDLAISYTTTPPDELLPPLRRHLGYVMRLLDSRKTLAQHRQLLITGAWLATLTATVDIDLLHTRAGLAYLRVARDMAQQAEHDELVAWTLETEAWHRLTAGDYATALALSQQAQAVAPRGSSAHIQATAQEGRALARMGRVRETHDALTRTARLVGPMTPPDRPEHHYQYDPGKHIAYVATTLSWVGDRAAVDYARGVVDQLAAEPVTRPRRVASARLDLALALVGVGDYDEAAGQATAAVTSGRVVASNWWRVREIVRGIEGTAAPEAVELREAVEAYQPGHASEPDEDATMGLPAN